MERFQQRDVMTMFQDVDRFGSGEVDLPITNADVHRHLEFLALCLRITNLTTSALWTVDLPSLDISAETENGVVAYRETQAILQSRRHEQEQSLAREAKRRKFIEMEEGDDWDHDLLTWLDELPDDISDEGPTQVRYEPQRRQQAQAMVIQTPDRHDQHRDTNGQDQAFFLESMLNVCTTLEGSVTRLAGLFDGVNEKLDMILSNQATRKQSGKEVIHDDTCYVEAGNSTNSSNLYLSSIEERIRQTISNLSTEIVTISRLHSTTHQAVADLQNNINVWREGILNELTGIYIGIQNTRTDNNSNLSTITEVMQLNATRIDAVLAAAMDMIEDVHQFRVQSEFSSRMLRGIDDDVQYIREHVTETINNTNRSPEQQLQRTMRCVDGGGGHLQNQVFQKPQTHLKLMILRIVWTNVQMMRP